MASSNISFELSKQQWNEHISQLNLALSASIDYIETYRLIGLLIGHNTFFGEESQREKNRIFLQAALDATIIAEKVDRPQHDDHLKFITMIQQALERVVFEQSQEKPKQAASTPSPSMSSTHTSTLTTTRSSYSNSDSYVPARPTYNTAPGRPAYEGYDQHYCQRCNNSYPNCDC